MNTANHYQSKLHIDVTSPSKLLCAPSCRPPLPPLRTLLTPASPIHRVSPASLSSCHLAAHRALMTCRSRWASLPPRTLLPTLRLLVRPLRRVRCCLNSSDWLLLQLMMIGDQAVGKTALLVRYADSEFHEHLLPTIGIDFKIKVCHPLVCTIARGVDALLFVVMSHSAFRNTIY